MGGYGTALRGKKGGGKELSEFFGQRGSMSS